MKNLIEDMAKYLMLLLLVLPCAALATDAAGRTENLMLKSASAATILSWTVIALIGGFENRPHVANIFAWAWVAWPLILLVAKGWNADLSWASLWLSVPVMSWYLGTMTIQFHHPASGGGGGMGAGLVLLIGWSYILIPFAILSGIFLAGRGVLRMSRMKST